MDEFKTKGIVAAFVAVISYALSCFTELVAILVIFMIFDYITGVLAAFVEKKVQSSIGLKGILKKIGFMILVTLAFFLDYLITNFALDLGIVLPINGAFGLGTTIWLIGNEGISIIENLGVIGVPIPDFLRRAFSKLKKGDGEHASN